MRLERIFLVFIVAMSLGPLGSADQTSDGSSRPQPGSTLVRRFQPNGAFVVSARRRGHWIEIGSVQADKYVRVSLIDLPRWVRGPAAMLRVSHTGEGNAHLDQLSIGGKSPMGIGAYMDHKLAEKDDDLVDARTVTYAPLRFGIAPGTRPRLVLAGRIEPAMLSDVPFQYPLSNIGRAIDVRAEFYQYRLGDNPHSLKVDGSLADEDLGNAFMEEYYPVGSGHPDVPTYAWIRDDGEHLYVAIDLVGDNTLDSGADYAKIYIRTDDGVQIFPITTSGTDWGRAAYEYTNRASWEHKTYEFAIPFEEIGKLPDETVEIAMAAYGTFAPDAEPRALHPDRRAQLLGPGRCH